ncbi:hypothetical protein [Corynebacterium ulceribovis]|uniref:hypothetical protein n=1 Tax=Corynebacterium ulceribovis TaxID=487732 RepID=UPI0003695073|nr:hypothetical protein [Corynebacterium ulceribovis]
MSITSTIALAVATVVTSAVFAALCFEVRKARIDMDAIERSIRRLRSDVDLQHEFYLKDKSHTFALSTNVHKLERRLRRLERAKRRAPVKRDDLIRRLEEILADVRAISKEGKG